MVVYSSRTEATSAHPATARLKRLSQEPLVRQRMTEPVQDPTRSMALQIGCRAAAGMRAMSAGRPVAILAPFVAGSGPNVNDPIARGDYLHIMLDDDDGIADPPVRSIGLKSFSTSSRMQAGGWFVEDVQRIPSLRTLKFGR